MLWSAYHCVHGTSCFCTLSTSAFMHWTIPTWGRFLFRNLFMETCFCSFLIKKLQLFVTRYRPRNCGWCVIRARVHWRMASNNQPPRPPQSSPQKIAGVRSQLRSKRSSNGPPSENFLATGGFFERNTYRVTALGWLKKKEERKKKERRRWTILSFDRFRFATLK